MEEKLNKIIGLLEEIAEINNIPVKSSSLNWCEAERTTMMELYYQGYSTSKIAILLSKEFNTKRSTYAINLAVVEHIKKEEASKRKTLKAPVIEVKEPKSILDGIYDEEPPF